MIEIEYRYYDGGIHVGNAVIRILEIIGHWSDQLGAGVLWLLAPNRHIAINEPGYLHPLRSNAFS